MRALTVEPAGTWPTSRETGRLLADFDQRFRRRVLHTTEAGWTFLLDLRTPTRLRHGDGLILENGGIVRVVSLEEDLVEITTFDDRALVVLAWHLGNRHLPVQALRHSLRIRANATIEDMLEGLGATITPIRAAFDPEPGAYDHG
jgi:urease accessory protein